MGSFYTSITLRGPSQKAVGAALRGREALVSAEEDGCVVVFDAECEDQDPVVLSGLAARLSREFSCPALAVLNHDDDILFYALYDRGRQRDEYDSTPGFSSNDDPFADPKGGDAEVLCAAFGSSQIAEVNEILRANVQRMGAMRRHAELVEVLGLPSWLPGAGFNYVAQGDVPSGLDESTLLATS